MNCTKWAHRALDVTEIRFTLFHSVMKCVALEGDSGNFLIGPQAGERIHIKVYIRAHTKIVRGFKCPKNQRAVWCKYSGGECGDNMDFAWIATVDRANPPKSLLISPHSTMVAGLPQEIIDRVINGLLSTY